MSNIGVNILAIDQSLSNSGIAVHHWGEIINQDPIPNFSYHNIKPPKTLKGVLRIGHIEGVLTDYLHKYKADTLVIEDYAYSASYQAHQAGELGGALKMLAFELGLPCVIMPIGIHKKFTTGNGSAKKDLMIKAVYKGYGVDVDDHNLADAVSILRTYMGFVNPEDNTKVQNEALKKLKPIVEEANNLIKD